ncbi:MAG: hypothetical protein ABI323_11815, partial [Solirubrobacteraceae bacterium]
MARPGRGGHWWRHPPTLLLVVGLALCVVVAGFDARPSPGATWSLGIVLVIAAVAAGATAVYLGGHLSIAISASVIV